MPVGIYLKQAALFREALRLKEKGPEHLAAFLKTNRGPTKESEHPAVTAILKSTIPFGLGFLDLIPDKVLGARFQISAPQSDAGTMVSTRSSLDQQYKAIHLPPLRPVV